MIWRIRNAPNDAYKIARSLNRFVYQNTPKLPDYIMRALLTIITIPLGILNLCGSLVAGIWLAILGEWQPIGVGLLLLVSSHFMLSLVLMPGLIFAAPAAIAMESGKTILGSLIGGVSVLYTEVIVVGWAYLMLGYFHGLASASSEIPLLLWSYGAAIGPWAFMASKDGDNPHSWFSVFFLSLGYISCILALLLGHVSLVTCLVILSVFMAASCILSVVYVIAEIKTKAAYG
jgi:hypothetical protein